MISIDDIKEFLNLPVEETTYDVFLTKMRDQSIGRINNYCRREINYGARIETIDGKGEDIFLLKNYPLDSVDYIKYRESNSGFDHELCDPATDIIPVNKIGKIILLNGITLTEGKSNIQIKYFAGYSDDAEASECQIPQDLKYACLIMTVESFLKSFQAFDNQLGSRFGMARFTHSLSDGTNDSRIDYLFKEENYYDILKRYRSTRI